MAYTQEKRLIAIDTPLGKDVLFLQSFRSHEGISQLFHFSLELLSENHSIAFKDIVGKQVTISLHLASGEKRYWNGYVSRFACVGRDNRFSYYRAEVVPWLWFLTRTADCRIFQDMTIPEIVETVFRLHGFQDFKRDLQGSFPQREYCVQYRETSFNFVSRLMEECGIFYFFEHDKNTHKLIMANYQQTHKNCPVQHKVRFNYSPGASLIKEKEDVVSSWTSEQELRPGKYALTDYNFQTPGTSLMAKVDTIAEIGGNKKYEIYDYPGIHAKKAEGDDVVKVRMQEEEALHYLISGSGNCRTFASGYKIHLDEHTRKDMNGDYVLTEVTHSASVGESYSSSGEAASEIYSNSFVCIPFSVLYRPQRLTPKPVVQGPQTAVVKGKKGEEIWTDKYGRVKVRFHWDRLEKKRKGDQEEEIKDEERSCWIRVSQPWAGKNWGAISIPRIGQEVIVEFLEGDPDRPIITGRVYNDEQMPPYTLADNQTRTTFMSRSSKDGGSSNYNEIRFEDKKDSEQIFINAEKDMDLRVEKDSREFVGKDRSLIVKGDQKEKVEGDLHAEAGGNRNEKVGQNMSLQVGQALNEKTGMKFAHEAGQEIHLKAGMNVVIEAGLELTIKASGGFINIGPAGVAISGTLVLINSGGAAGAGSGSSPQDPQKPDEADDGSKGGKM